MKLLLIASLFIAGCSVATPSQEEVNEINHRDPAYTGSYNTDTSAGGCVTTKFSVVMVDGNPTMKSELVSCNEGININKGCPSPDKGRPPEDINLINQNITKY